MRPCANHQGGADDDEASGRDETPERLHGAEETHSRGDDKGSAVPPEEIPSKDMKENNRKDESMSL